MIAVVDAGVAAMWFLPEEHSEKAATPIDSDHGLVAPDLLRLEVGSVLPRAARRGWVDPADATAALDRLAPPSIRFEPAGAYADAAWEIAMRHGGAIHDGVYVAVARALQAALVTNDSGLAETARARHRDLAAGRPAAGRHDRLIRGAAAALSARDAPSFRRDRAAPCPIPFPGV